MTLSFLVIALVTLAGAVAAMSLRQLVHCALGLVVTFAGLAAFFLQLNAEFIGLAQVLVYVGAVAILIVFAILLTRGTEPEPSGLGPTQTQTQTPWGLVISGAAFFTLASAVVSSGYSGRVALAEVKAPVRAIGDRLMAEYVLPLEVVGLLLTAAMIGAVVIALRDKKV